MTECPICQGIPGRECPLCNGEGKIMYDNHPMPEFDFQSKPKILIIRGMGPPHKEKPFPMGLVYFSLGLWTMAILGVILYLIFA